MDQANYSEAFYPPIAANLAEIAERGLPRQDPLCRLFVPRYGKHFAVRPKHWWNRGQRREARRVAALADWMWENGGREDFHRRASRALLFGEPFVSD